MNLVDYSKEIKLGGFVKFKDDTIDQNLEIEYIKLSLLGIDSLAELKTKKFKVVSFSFDKSGIGFIDSDYYTWPKEFFNPTI